MNELTHYRRFKRRRPVLKSLLIAVAVAVLLFVGGAQ